MSTNAHARQRTRVAAALFGSSVLLLLVLPGVSLASTNPPGAPPDADGRCDTRPTSYPGNGIPVPDDASCSVVLTRAGTATAEVWSWADADGLNWYNYLVEGYAPGGGSLLTMCATDDEAAEDLVYECTTDSYYLLFTMANLFVTWPSAIEPDHYYCESVDVIAPDGVLVTSYACGTINGTSDDDSALGPPPPTSPPPTSPPPTSQPPAVPTTEPIEPVDDDPIGPDEPSQPGGSVGGPAPTTPAVTAVVTSGPDAQNPRGLPEDAFDPVPTATPVESQWVARVGGAAFPVSAVFVVAGALALGGVGVLAGPGAIAAVRRRT